MKKYQRSDGLKELKDENVTRHNKEEYVAKLNELLKIEEKFNDYVDKIDKMILPIQANRLVDKNAHHYTTLANHKKELSKESREKIIELDKRSRTFHNMEYVTKKDITELHEINKELKTQLKMIKSFTIEDIESDEAVVKKYHEAQTTMEGSGINGFFKHLLGY